MLPRGIFPRCSRFLPLLWLAAVCSCDEVFPGDLPATGDEPTSLERAKAQDSVDSLKQSKSAPESEVVYTIVRGGTLRNVANLYKIHYHEVFALNPVLDPDQELEPSTTVVVHRDSGSPSESVGFPHDGKLVGAMPLPDGAGRKITAERWKTWGTRSTIQQLDHLLTRWSELNPKAPPVLIGNLSARNGGPLSPHKTHQSGRDVDVSYIAQWNGKDPVTWQHMNARNLDAEATWKLLKLFAREGDLEVVFIDRTLQKVLLSYAKTHGTIRASRLGNWLEVANTGGEPALIRHVPGHKDHIHIRFACPETERRCRS